MVTIVLALTQQVSASGSKIDITSGKPLNQSLVPFNTKPKQYSDGNSIVTKFNSVGVKKTTEYDDGTIVTEFTDGSSLISIPPGVNPYQGIHPVTIGSCIGAPDKCDEFGLDIPPELSKSKSKSKSKPKSKSESKKLVPYGPEPEPPFDIKQLTVKNVLEGVGGFGSYSWLLTGVRHKHNPSLVSTPLRDAAVAAASLIGGWAILMAT